MRSKFTVAERFWAKVNKEGPVPAHRPELGPCWEWTGALSKNTHGGGGGYGLFFEKTGGVAHRWAYQQEHGALPSGVLLDHLCRNRRCVRSVHLEPVSNRVNVLRGIGPSAENALKAHCVRGHPLSGDNLYEYRGRRHCRQCRSESDKRRNAGKPPHPSQRTHCPQGHPYAGEHLSIERGKRVCRTCKNEQKRDRYQTTRSKGKGLPESRTHCPHGHAYDEANTIVKQGRRHCRTCVNERQRRGYQARRAKQGTPA